MAASGKKTLILILVVLMILWACLRITPLLFAPLGVLAGPFHILRSCDLPEIHGWPGYFHYYRLHLFWPLVMLIIWVAILIWVYRDAEKRGMNGVLWALLVFIGNLIGLLIYLIIRTENVPAAGAAGARQTCPGCRKSVPAGFAFCPSCGIRLRNVCAACGKPAEAGWNVCPHCGEQFQKGEKTD